MLGLIVNTACPYYTEVAASGSDNCTSDWDQGDHRCDRRGDKRLMAGCRK